MGGVSSFFAAISKVFGGGEKSSSGGVASGAAVGDNEASRISKETAGKPAQRAIGRARGGTNTIFTSSLGMGGMAALARKTLLGQ